MAPRSGLKIRQSIVFWNALRRGHGELRVKTHITPHQRGSLSAVDLCGCPHALQSTSSPFSLKCLKSFFHFAPAVGKAIKKTRLAKLTIVEPNVEGIWIHETVLSTVETVHFSGVKFILTLKRSVNLLKEDAFSFAR